MPRGIKISPDTRVIRGGNYIVRIDTGRISKRIGRGADKAFKQWASDATAGLQQMLSKPFPPASTPGSPPHRRTGRLRGSTSVRAIGGRNPRIEIRTVSYGKWLDQGTRNMAARPFITRFLDKGGIERLVRQTKKSMAREVRKR